MQVMISSFGLHRLWSLLTYNYVGELFLGDGLIYRASQTSSTYHLNHSTHPYIDSYVEWKCYYKPIPTTFHNAITRGVQVNQNLYLSGLLIDGVLGYTALLATFHGQVKLQCIAGHLTVLHLFEFGI